MFNFYVKKENVSGKEMAIKTPFQKIVDRDDDFITINELKEALASENLDRIYRILNTVKGMDYQGDILPLIKDFWNLDLESHPSIPINILTRRSY